MTRPIVHLELHTGDLRGARDLYSAVCGWQPERIDTAHGAYLAVSMGEGLGGGIVASAAPRPLWLPYVAVEEVGEATARARERGARVLLEPREGPAGWRSVVATPAGGQIAFWQQKEDGSLSGAAERTCGTRGAPRAGDPTRSSRGCAR